MIPGILITIVGGGSALLTYALIERHINQRACPRCGFRVSGDGLEEQCPRCRGSQGTRRVGIGRLPRAVLIALPLLIVTVDAGVLVYSRSQPRTDKAIRLVKGSSSRIENFTVQQYIYATLCERKDKSAITVVDGWRAEQQPGSNRLLSVEFDFARDAIPHQAVWEVDLSAEKVTPRNEDARNLSWNSFQF